MRGVDHDPLRFAALARQFGEYLVEHAQAAPADEPIVDRLVRAIVARSVAPTQPVVGLVNTLADDRDLVVSSAGGVVGELVKGWRAKSTNTFDSEMGSSTMGYEIAGGWGAAMANPNRNTFVMLGDGSYLMMDSDIYSTVLAGHKIIVVVCDNGGFAVINRLQNGKGGISFNNLIRDCRSGCRSRSISRLTRLRWARSPARSTISRGWRTLSPGPRRRTAPQSSASRPTHSNGPLATPGGMWACLKSARGPRC